MTLFDSMYAANVVEGNWTARTNMDAVDIPARCWCAGGGAAAQRCPPNPRQGALGARVSG
jgi:hypothetical protein